MVLQPYNAARDMRRAAPRMAVFCAASIALHALTLVAYRPFGISGAPEVGPATVLHATLTRAANLVSEPSESLAPDASAQNAASSSNAGREQQARAGSADGLNLPFADKWFTAQELDVRAEPLTSVTIEYPDELAGSGIAGRVQLLLFIDERGAVRKVEVARAVPEGLFDKAAASAWVDVRFSPAMKGGVAVKSQKLLELYYSPF